MHAKNNFIILPLLLLSFLSCRKEMPPKYSGEDIVYFRNANTFHSDLTNIQGFYQAEKAFSFLISNNQIDTMRFNKVPSFNLSIRTDGRLSDKDRPVLLELEGNGKEYAVLPPPDSIYIRANEVEFMLDLKLARPPLSDTSVKKLTLILKNNDPFKPENHIWSRFTYVFGNIFLKPNLYYLQETFYGEFSAAKMITIQAAIDRKGAAYWQSHADMTTLNNFIDQRGGKHLNFDPFTYSDLYNYFDNTQMLIYDITTGPVRTAFNNVNAEIISLSKALLTEKKNAGEPVLDETGREISFP